MLSESRIEIEAVHGVTTPSAPRARLHDLTRTFQPRQGHGTSERNLALDGLVGR